MCDVQGWLGVSDAVQMLLFGVPSQLLFITHVDQILVLSLPHCSFCDRFICLFSLSCMCMHGVLL